MNTKIDIKQVKNLYHSGMNMRQVAEAIGVSNSDICKFMIKHNINARSSWSKARGDKRVKLEKKKCQEKRFYQDLQEKRKKNNFEFKTINPIH